MTIDQLEERWVDTLKRIHQALDLLQPHGNNLDAEDNTPSVRAINAAFEVLDNTYQPDPKEWIRLLEKYRVTR